MCFESGLLYLLIPVIKLITDEEYYIGFKERYFSEIEIINSLDYSQFIFFAITMIVLAFLAKYFFNDFDISTKSIHSNLTSNLSVRVFRTFLEKNILFVNINSSEVIKNLQIDVSYFGALTQSLLSFIIELFLSLAVILSLIYLETESAIIAGSTIIISAYIYYLSTRNKLKLIGKRRSNFEKNVAKIVMEGIQGIKDLKIYNKENDFLEDLSNKEYGKAKLLAIYNTLNQVPRLIFEFIGILAIMTIIIYKLNFVDDKTNLFVTIGLFVAATFKLLPSINRIIGSLQNINYHKTTLDILFNVFKDHITPIQEMKKIKFLNEIELNDVSFSYEKDKAVLHNLNLTIKKGEFIGLMGKSGVGKEYSS